LGGRIPENQNDNEERDWHFGRTLSSCVIAEGLLYVADVEGFVLCLDAKTGKKFWHHDLKAYVYGSPLWVDGHLFLGNGDGEVAIFAHGKEKKPPRIIDVGPPVSAAPVFANGVLYIAMSDRLLAIQEKR
jgi:hypothetical protein